MVEIILAVEIIFHRNIFCFPLRDDDGLPSLLEAKVLGVNFIHNQSYFQTIFSSNLMVRQFAAFFVISLERQREGVEPYV
jgi:hypothetical protein